MKCVTFNEKTQIKYMHVWQYAYKKCRLRYWEIVAIDRCRFERRIRNFEKMYVKIMKPVKCK